jgi:hypothetical protein
VELRLEAPIPALGFLPVRANVAARSSAKGRNLNKLEAKVEGLTAMRPFLTLEPRAYSTAVILYHMVYWCALHHPPVVHQCLIRGVCANLHSFVKKEKTVARHVIQLPTSDACTCCATTAATASTQGLTLVHCLAQRKHILWDTSGA